MLKKQSFIILTLFACGLITASQQEFRRIYDPSINVEWILGSKRFSVIHYENPERNLVFCGEFNSDSDIIIKAKNVLVVGVLSAPRVIHIRTEADFCNAGFIGTGIINVEGRNFWNGLDDQAIARMQELGIDIALEGLNRESIRISTPS